LARRTKIFDDAMRGFRVIDKKLDEVAAPECFQELRSMFIKFDVRRNLKQYGMCLEETRYENLLSTAAKAS